MDFDKIIYMPDRYYINLDRFEVGNLNTILEDAMFSLQLQL